MGDLTSTRPTQSMAKMENATGDQKSHSVGHFITHYDVNGTKRVQPRLMNDILMSAASVHGEPFLSSTPNKELREYKSFTLNDSSVLQRNRSASPKRNSQRTSTPLTNGTNRVTIPITSYSTSFATESENLTIQKQRQELQLLISELKVRDQELNDMVVSHQKHLLAWEEDRQKVLTLEQRLTRLNANYHTKKEECQNLKSRLKISQSQQMENVKALESTQEHLVKVSEEQSLATMQLKELEESNTSMNSSLREMGETIGKYEAREQELLTMLKLKDQDLLDASSHIAELSSRLKKMDNKFRDFKTTDTELRKQIDDWKNKSTSHKNEIDRLRSEISKLQQEREEFDSEKQQLRSEISALKTDVEIIAEREKRKDELILLQKSRQERTDTEMANLRQIYDRQQKDLQLLHLNLESSKTLLAKQHASFDEQSNDCGESEKSFSQYSLPFSPSKTSLPNENGYTGSFGADPNVSFQDQGSENGLCALSSVDTFSSPTSKLHRLLAESRQMVESLEKVTIPPSNSQKSYSPTPQNSTHSLKTGEGDY